MLVAVVHNDRRAAVLVFPDETVNRLIPLES